MTLLSAVPQRPPGWRVHRQRARQHAQRALPRDRVRLSTGDVATTLVFGGGRDRAAALAIRAIGAFSGHPETHATVEVTCNRMVVTENGFTLVCTRAGLAGSPAPRPT